jgi:hypothetical protein
MRTSAIAVDNFFTHVYDVHFKPATFSAPSYHELIGGREEQKFVSLLMQEREGRLVIMCDEDAMMKLTLRTMKTLLPNASAATGYTMMKYMYLPYFYLHDSGLVSFIGPNDYQMIYTNFVAREAEFKAHWTRTKPWKLTKRQLDKAQQTAGVELQTATYLANPTWRFAADYKDKVVTFAKKSLLAMLVNDLRQKILDGFVDIEKLNRDFDPLNRDVVDQVSADATFKFLTDTKFTPNNWKYVFETYDMAALHELFQTYAPLRAFNLNDFSLLAKENDLTFEDVLAHEQQSQCGRRLLGADVNYKDTVNVYLLDMIFDLHKNDRSAVRQFSLERLPKG